MLVVTKPSPRVEDQPPPDRSRRGVLLVGLALLVVWMLMALVLVVALATDL
jgi:hypothetical protein